MPPLAQLGEEVTLFFDRKQDRPPSDVLLTWPMGKNIADGEEHGV
jgi:hypothetical protein